MSFWEDLDFGKMAESISENAGDWIDGAVSSYQKEANAQPEANDEKAKHVTFGDGKEAPTATVNTPLATPLINGIDNKMLLGGAVGLIAVVLIAKG